MFDEQSEDVAVKVCDGCPMLEECAELGARQMYGVWGGRRPKDRGFGRTKRHRVPRLPSTTKDDVLTLLIDSHRTVEQLTQALPVTRSAVKHVLQTLEREGRVTCRRQSSGPNVYSIARDPAHKVPEVCNADLESVR